ncbi:MAG: hypothetical protein JWQ57_1674 [Mucilaginibacter sp.]|nr:hypothetical protein [Mucilaginibacter sp.]
MKTLGNKSLSSFLFLIVRAIWWIEWFCLVAIIAVAMVALYFRKGFVLSIPVSYDALNIRQLHPLQQNFPTAHLYSSTGNFSIHVYAGSFNCFLFFTALLLFFMAISIITHQLKVILSNFRSGVPFNSVTISKINYIAILLIGCSVIQLLLNISINYYFRLHVALQDVNLNYSFNFTFFTTGIVLLIVAGILKMGLSIEEENRFTI